ncbi:MAG: sigma-54-dependent Fis family transcriptional regulator, partial [Planctomycetota bacterium]|nr:sigma-54-dependent Fis family transcriptional regulator [Planctomycetota bacterium]
GQALWSTDARHAPGADDAALPFVLSPDGLGLLSVVERLLQCTQGLAPFLDLLLALLVEHTKAERGLLLLPGADGELTVAALRALDPALLETAAFQVSRGLVGEAARRREPVLVRDALDDARYRDRQSVVQSRLRSALVVPLVLERRTVGVLYLDNTSVTRCFNEVDQRLLVAFAGLVAGPLDQSVRLERRASSADARPDARPPGFDAIVGQSRAVRDLLAHIARLAPSDLPVVVLGESGTGKELVARALHGAGLRPRGPFQAESCSALPDALAKSLLCGHERGAFSGADEARPGLLELADGGTLFLDDVDAMSEAVQVELLRVLQEGEVRRLGATRPRSLRVRVVCATRRPLEELVAEGALREDLFYRLNVLPLRVPPLRERREDVPLLLAHFAAAQGAGALSFSPAARRLLGAHEWPGNVRQLENEVRRLAALLPPGSVVEPADLDPSLRGQAVEEGLALGEGGTLKDATEALERRMIGQALARAHGNRALAARLLGLSRSGLHLKLQRYG